MSIVDDERDNVTCSLSLSDTLHIQKDAIGMAWELLTKVYKLDPARLYVTYFGGDVKAGLQPDLEAKQLWLDMGLPESRVLPFGCKENFWGR